MIKCQWAVDIHCPYFLCLLNEKYSICNLIKMYCAKLLPFLYLYYENNANIILEKPIDAKMGL